MIDMTRTLARGTGVADAFSLLAPDETNPLWVAGARLTDVEGLDGVLLPFSARTVGAHGHTRTDALVRGAGEAVERFALHPRPGIATVRGRAGDLGQVTVPVHRSDVALGAPETEHAVLTWMPGRRLRDDTEVLLPAPLVDWPSTDPDAHLFDPGPSGAASGEGPAMALRAALLEIVERDAVICAWERSLKLPCWTDLRTIEVPPSAQAAAQSADIAARAAALALADRASADRVEVSVATVPTAVPGLWCVVAALVDPDGPEALASVGLRTSTRPWSAVLGALREAWQVRTVLQLSRADAGDPGVVATERDRIDHMVSPAGVGSVRAWVAGFVPAEVVPVAAEVTTTGLIEAIVSDGGDPVAVDLTPRLPRTLRAMGWNAVKVLPVGYQHLPMDERRTWSRNLPRLASAPARTGCAARHDGAVGRPHPLP